MKNNIVIILIAGAIAAPILAEAQGGLLSQRRGHGAPNSLTNQQGGQDSQNGTVNRGTLRRPFNSESQEGNRGQTGQGRGNQRGGQTGNQQGGQRGSGMSTSPRGGNNSQGNHGQTGNQQGGQRGQGGQGNQGSTLRERLNLSEEQLSKLRAAYKEWKSYAKSIHQNQQLSQEEKKTKLKAGFKKYDAKVREILTREQYAKLVQIRRNASRPNQNNNNTGQGGHSRAQHRSEIRELLQLTEEQMSKLRAIHQYATKKIKAIIANEELTRDEKNKKIKEVKKQAHNRRMQVLTEEQKRKLREYYARHRAQHQQQNGTHNSGQPRGRQQGNTNGENPQRQQSGQRGQRGNSSGQSQGRNHGNTNGQNPQRQQGGNNTRPQNGQHTSQSDKVILYVAPGCGYCTKAAKLLRENNVDFVKVDISSDHAARRELARKTREANIQWRGGVPVTDARGNIIVGYNRTALSRIE